MSKELKDKKEINNWLKRFEEPSTDFKDIYISMLNKKKKIQAIKLESFAIFSQVLVKEIECVKISGESVVKLLDSLSRTLSKYMLESKNTKPSEFKLTELEKQMKEGLFRFENEMKYLHDSLETVMHIVTFNHDGDGSFTTSTRTLFENSLISSKDYSIVKLFTKIRNLFIHNSNISKIVLEVIVEDIPLIQAVMIELGNVYSNLVKNNESRLRLFMFDLVYLKRITPTRKASIYDYYTLVNIVKENEKKLRMRTLIYKPLIDIPEDKDVLRLTCIKYQLYLQLLSTTISLEELEDDVEEGKEELLKILDEALEEHLDKVMPDELKTDREKNLLKNIVLDIKELPYDNKVKVKAMNV